MAITAEIIDHAVGDTFLTGNPILVEVTGNGCPEGGTDYRLLLKVKADNQLHIGAGEWTDQIIPDASDQAVFDIHGYIDLPVPADFHFPFTTPVNGYYDRLTLFNIIPGESYIDANGDLQETWSEEPGTWEYRAIRGGVSERTLAEWTGDGTDFNTIYPGAEFLTNQANNRWVLPTQPVKLWLCHATGNSFAASLVVVATYDDGSTETSTTNFTAYTDAINEFDVNPGSLGLTVDNGTKRVVSFTATVDGPGVRTFYVDWNNYERPFFLLYQNGLGGIDDVSLTGGWQTGYRASMVTVWQPLPTASNNRSSTVQVAGKTGSRVWKINTGIKTNEELEVLAGDILMSKNAWLLVPTQNPSSISDYSIIPVIIEAGEITATSWDNDIASMDITFTEAHDNKYF